MSRGLQRERDLVNLLREDGWWSIRSPASKGDVDVVAMKAGESTRFVEVKSTSRSPYHSFGPECRRELSEAAAMAGAEAWLVWWPKYGAPQWYHESVWPVDRSSTKV